jgi:hypothetical protein
MTKKTKIYLSEGEYDQYNQDNYGVCLNCEELTEGGVEPDAEGYLCESCEQRQVMGIEQALVDGYICLTDDDGNELDESGGRFG